MLAVGDNRYSPQKKPCNIELSMVHIEDDCQYRIGLLVSGVVVGDLPPPKAQGPRPVHRPLLSISLSTALLKISWPKIWFAQPHAL